MKVKIPDSRILATIDEIRNPVVPLDPDQWASKSVVPLISLSTTYKQDEPAKLVRS